jgi:hypothetical protein
MMDDREKFEIEISKATGLDLSLGEMQMEYGPGGYSRGKISFVMNLDKEKTKDVCKIFGITRPSGAIDFIGYMNISGFQE